MFPPVDLKVKLAIVVGVESEDWEKVLRKEKVGILDQICSY